MGVWVKNSHFKWGFSIFRWLADVRMKNNVASGRPPNFGTGTPPPISTFMAPNLLNTFGTVMAPNVLNIGTVMAQ